MPGAGLVLPAGGGGHHVHHMLGVIFPVGGQVEHAARFEGAAYLLDKGRLHNAAFVVLFLVPGVGKVELDAAEAGVGDALLQHLDGIVEVGVAADDVLEILTPGGGGYGAP